jgi:nucleotide-binding universal stress UspA family protein
MRILLAIDDSPFSWVAVRSVAERPWPAGSEIRIFHAIELPPVFSFTGTAWPDPPVDLSALSEAEQSRGKQLLERATQELSPSGCAVTTRLVEGSARTTILEEVREWPADLVVLGSHGTKGLTSLLLGSVSQTILSHAPCSVAIIRTSAERRTTPSGRTGEPGSP